MSDVDSVSFLPSNLAAQSALSSLLTFGTMRGMMLSLRGEVLSSLARRVYCYVNRQQALALYHSIIWELLEVEVR